MLLKSLVSSSMTLSQCFRLINMASDHVEPLMSSINGLLLHLSQEFPEISQSATYVNLREKLTDFTFSDIDTDYQLQRFLESQASYVAPETIVLGYSTDTRESDGFPRTVQVPLTAQYISIKEVLTKIILRHDSVIDECHRYSELLRSLKQDGVFLDFAQAKTHTETVGGLSNVSIQLYYDDIETANPIGSRAGIHKLGCFYWVLKNIPYWRLSDMRMINVVAIANTLDFHQFGFEPILSRIARDIKDLENGFTVITESGAAHTFDTCTLSFVADNLGYHQVMGFQESFSGRCCTICTARDSEFSTLHYQDNSLLRDSKTTSEQAEAASQQGSIVNGVKRPSALRTRLFDPYCNYSVDIQHDFF